MDDIPEYEKALGWFNDLTYTDDPEIFAKVWERGTHEKKLIHRLLYNAACRY